MLLCGLTRAGQTRRPCIGHAVSYPADRAFFRVLNTISRTPYTRPRYSQQAGPSPPSHPPLRQSALRSPNDAESDALTHALLVQSIQLQPLRRWGSGGAGARDSLDGVEGMDEDAIYSDLLVSHSLSSRWVIRRPTNGVGHDGLQTGVIRARGRSAWEGSSWRIINRAGRADDGNVSWTRQAVCRGQERGLVSVNLSPDSG